MKVTFPTQCCHSVRLADRSPSRPHIRMALSPPHEASNVPDGLQVTNQHRASGCAFSLWTSDKVSFISKPVKCESPTCCQTAVFCPLSLTVNWCETYHSVMHTRHRNKPRQNYSNGLTAREWKKNYSVWTEEQSTKVHKHNHVRNVAIFDC